MTNLIREFEEKEPNPKAISLSVLVQQVHDEEAQLGYVSKERLVSMAEFILACPGKYSKFEYAQALEILATYHLAHLAARRQGWKALSSEAEEALQG